MRLTKEQKEQLDASTAQPSGQPQNAATKGKGRWPREIVYVLNDLGKKCK